jgi:hypothetical protein
MTNSNIQVKTAALPVRIVASLFSKEGHARYGRRAYQIKKLLTSLCTVLVLLAPLVARAQTATVLDPQGDAYFSEGHEAPAFLDILAASFTISDTLTFTVDVAGSLDALPNPPGSGGVFAWHFPLNTNPSTDPPGFPLPPGQTAPAEFGVDALWDGTAFSGVLFDRRPALTGGSALLYSIPVSVSGSRITLTVPADLAAQVKAAVVLPGATWNCFTLWNNTFLLGQGTDAIHGGAGVGADTIGRHPWPQ